MGVKLLSEEELIEDVERLYRELGRAPRINDIREHGAFSYEAYVRRWESIEDVLEAADIPPHNRINTGTGVDESDLIAEIEHLGEELGRPPTTVDVRDHGRYAHATYYNHFENFAEALERAGFQATERNMIPEENLLDAIRDLADELGRPPTGEEMNELGAYHAGTYYNRFGSWTTALEEADCSE